MNVSCELVFDFRSGWYYSVFYFVGFFGFVVNVGVLRDVVFVKDCVEYK